MGLDPSPAITPQTTPGAAWWRSAVLLLAAGGAAWLLLELRARQGELSAIAAAACRRDPAAVAKLRSWLHVVLAIAPASTLGFAAYLATVARGVRRTGTFPPPGSWTIPARRPATGPAARRIAVVLLLLAATLTFLALLLALLGARMLLLLRR